MWPLSHTVSRIAQWYNPYKRNMAVTTQITDAVFLSSINPIWENLSYRYSLLIQIEMIGSPLSVHHQGTDEIDYGTGTLTEHCAALKRDRERRLCTDSERNSRNTAKILTAMCRIVHRECQLLYKKCGLLWIECYPSKIYVEVLIPSTWEYDLDIGSLQI